MRELAEREDALENALLAARVSWRRRRAAAAHGAGASGDDHVVRGSRCARRRGAGRLDRVQRRAPLAARCAGGARGRSHRQPDPITRSEAEKGIRLRALLDAVDTARVATTAAYGPARDRWLDRLLGEASGGDTVVRARGLAAPAVAPREHVHPGALGAGVRGHAPLSRSRRGGDTRDPARPGGSSAEVATRVRDPVGPARARAPDHAGPGWDARLRGVPARGRARAALRRVRPRASVCVPAALPRPRADGDLLVPARLDRAASPAGTRSTSASTRPTAREHAAAASFVNALLFRRYTRKARLRARLLGPVRAGRRHRPGYSTRLTGATGVRYPDENYLADMDSGFYSADYLRAWVRSAQVRAWLRREVAPDWWRRPATGELLPTCSARGRGRRPRRSPHGSASTRSTRHRSPQSSTRRHERANHERAARSRVHVGCDSVTVGSA